MKITTLPEATLLAQRIRCTLHELLCSLVVDREEDVRIDVTVAPPAEGERRFRLVVGVAVNAIDVAHAVGSGASHKSGGGGATFAALGRLLRVASGKYGVDIQLEDVEDSAGLNL